MRCAIQDTGRLQVLLLLSLWTIARSTLDPSYSQIVIVYDDDACEKPVMIRYSTIGSPDACISWTRCGTVRGDHAKKTCSTLPPVDYAEQVFGDDPFMLYRWFDDLECDPRVGNGGYDIVVLDGACRRSAIFELSAENSALVSDFRDPRCQGSSKKSIELTTEDIEQRTCKAANWAYEIHYLSTAPSVTVPPEPAALPTPAPAPTPVSNISTGFKYQLVLVYDDAQCQDPGMIRVYYLNSTSDCESWDECGNVNGDNALRACTNMPLVEYAEQQFGERPFMLNRWYDDLLCNPHAGSWGDDFVVLDGVCRRSATYELLGDNSVVVSDYRETSCTGDSERSIRLFPSDISRKTCRAANWAYEMRYLSTAPTEKEPPTTELLPFPSTMLPGFEHQVVVVYDDRECEQPGIIRYSDLNTSQQCESWDRCGPLQGDLAIKMCNNLAPTDFADESFGGEPYMHYRWFDDMTCDPEKGSYGEDIVILDGVCRRGATFKLLSDNSVIVTDYKDQYCKGITKRSFRLLPSDVTENTCKTANWAYQAKLISLGSGDESSKTSDRKKEIDPLDSSILDSTSSSSDMMTLVGALTGVAVVVVAVAAFLLFRRKRDNHKGETLLDEEDQQVHLGWLNTKSDAVPASSDYIDSNVTWSESARNQSEDDELALLQDLVKLNCRLDVKHLVDIRELGWGGSAVVWLVMYNETLLVVSKRLQDSGNLSKTRKFVAEIKLNATLDHPHIVKFIGVAWTSASDIQAVFEYMQRGDLQHWLRSTKDQKHTWSLTKTIILVDILRALEYVQSLERPVVHRDLKSGNILLSPKLRAKLSDFGVARLVSLQGTMTAGVGTALWLAPEVLADKGDYDFRADMFSFGVLISEVDSHETPYHDVRHEDGSLMTRVTIMHRVMSGELKPTFSSALPYQVVELASRCVEFDPASRPCASEALTLLQPLLDHRSISDM